MTRLRVDPYASLKRTALFLSVLALAAIAFGVGRLTAQQPGITRTVLQRANVPASPQHEAVMATAELAAGGRAGKHYHHGRELTYVLNGSVTLEVQGKAPQTYKAGDHFMIDPAAPHDVTSANGGKVLAVYVVEVGKPLAENKQ